MEADPDPYRVALLVVRALDALGVSHTIGGSIASAFAGEPRSTVDIDFVVALEDRHVAALISALGEDFYADEDALHRAIRTRTSANLIHRPTMLKVDLFVAGGTPLDDQQLERRQLVDLGAGRRLHVHPPEDILLQKLRWFREGGERSDRQWRDVAAIVRVQGDKLDRTYVRRYAPALGVADLVAKVLGEDS